MHARIMNFTDPVQPGNLGEAKTSVVGDISS
jgi:hypothetical protein